jgi:hypothetical protein
MDKDRRDLLATAVATAVVALPGIPLLTAAEAPCDGRGIGECLGPAILAGAYLLAAPVVLWVVLLVARVRGHFWVAVSTVLVAVVGFGAYVAASEGAGAVDLRIGVVFWPLSVLSALTAAMVVQRTARPWLLPAVLGGALAALYLLASLVGTVRAERDQVEDFRTSGVDLFVPELPGAEPIDAWQSSYPEGVAMVYRVDDGADPNVVVRLLEARPGEMCAAMFEYGHHDCREQAGVVRIVEYGDRHTVGLLRGRTLLTAEWSDSGFTPDEVLDAFRTAETVDAEAMADLG